VKFALAGDVLDTVNPYIPGRPHHRLVQSVADSGPLRKVLELCAGTGYASRLLAQMCPDAEVVGVDLSPEMVAVGRRKLRAAGLPNVALRVGDIADLPFPDGEFDAVMAVFGLHEVPAAVRRAAVAESARVLRHGGLFATVDLDRPPAPLGLLADVYFAVMEPGHAKQICGDGITALLEEAGFTIDRHSRAHSLGMTQTLLATA
jgi:ubiquinone/menaquinone biosynthesis C-methylase UbiE